MKFNLPEKTCIVCKKPFKWRKKWKLNWENVLYCSKKCRSKKNLKNEKDSKK